VEARIFMQVEVAVALGPQKVVPVETEVVAQGAVLIRATVVQIVPVLVP
jgi:hypothetical protein